ncbi:MAG: hypothetical protein WCY57_02500, partial [Micavibrio sp.]
MSEAAGKLSVRKNRSKPLAQRIRPLCLCVIGGGVLLGLAVPASAQSSDVLNRLKRIENEVDTLNRAVYKGEPPPPISQGANDSLIEFQGRLMQLESDLRNLTGR